MATQVQVANAAFVAHAASQVPELESRTSSSEYGAAWYSPWLSSLALVAGARRIEFMTFAVEENTENGWFHIDAVGLVDSVLVSGGFSDHGASAQSKHHVEALRLRDVSTWWFSSRRHVNDIELSTPVVAPGHGAFLSLSRIGSTRGYDINAIGDAASIQNRVPEMIDAILSRLSAD